MVAATTLQMLESGRSQIQQLDYKAEDRDGALAAFEIFRRAVIRAMRDRRGAQSNERCILENFESKRKYFDFLLDFVDRSLKHRARVSEVIRLLLESEAWKEAAQSDPDMFTAILGGIIDESDISGQSRSSRDHSSRSSRDHSPAPANKDLNTAATSRPSVAADPWTQRIDKAQASSVGSGRAGEAPTTPPKKVWSAPVDLWGPVSKSPTTTRVASVPSDIWATASPPKANASSRKASPRDDSRPSTNPFKSTLARAPSSPTTVAPSNPFKSLLPSRQHTSFPLYGRVA